MKSLNRTLGRLMAGICLAALPLAALALTGKVVDARTGKPLAGAIVTADQKVVVTGADGAFSIDTTALRGAATGVRAAGYRRTSLPPSANAAAPVVRLEPLNPKALYLSFYGIGSKVLRNAALDLIDQTELNALVVDVKGDRGMIPYRSKVALSAEIGGQRIITVRDMKEMIDHLHGRGVYLIGRIVVFKDDLLATARPQWAVRAANGKPWLDREKLGWVDAGFPEIWKYNIDIAEEAAQLGFDEIQFDYVRFPDTPGLVFSKENTEEYRVKSISGFLAAARQRLTPYNVFISADIFGYVSWNANDTFIGQRLDSVAPHVDYLAPMLYPSGFQFGIPGYRNPVANSYELISLTLKRAAERSQLPAVRFRPWLQSFKDYAFDRRPFGAQEISDQIRAADEFGSGGWMLWNPRNSYSKAGLKARTTPLTAIPSPSSQVFAPQPAATATAAATATKSPSSPRVATN